MKDESKKQPLNTKTAIYINIHCQQGKQSHVPKTAVLFDQQLQKQYSQKSWTLKESFSSSSSPLLPNSALRGSFHHLLLETVKDKQQGFQKSELWTAGAEESKQDVTETIPTPIAYT